MTAAIRSCTRVLVVAAALGLAPTASAQTVHIQGAMIGQAAVTSTLGLQWELPIGGNDLPAPGETVTAESRSWLVSLGAAGGYVWGRAPGIRDGLTGAGHGGVAYRLGGKVEQVGVVALVNTTPLGVGPAVRLKVLVVDLQAGRLWLTDRRGAHWFATVSIPVQFIRDVFR